MLDDAKELPNDPAALKGLVASLASELKFRDILIEKLKHQLSGLRRHQFGSRSESIEQLELTLEDEEIARATEAPPGPDDAAPTEEKRKPRRRPLPDHLRRHETVLGIGEECTACGGTEFKRRADDNEDSLKTRLMEYYKKTSPLIGYYYAKDMLTKVDGLGEIGEVQQAISKVLD